ncbi:MAG TPA: OB-fold nucleic acid binding domain-containing protein [Mycobacteriales bacterium]
MGATGLKERLRKITASQAEQEAAEIQQQCAGLGATQVTDCQLGHECSVAGTVRAVRLAPLAGAPTFEVDVWDGSGTIRLVFLGRRAIRGLETGRALLATGRLTRREGRLTIFNPRYEIVPAA